MKYLIGLLSGTLVGVAMFAALLYWNPFAGRDAVSPLAVASGNLLEFRYSLVPAETIAYANDGTSAAQPHPEKVQELWEPTVADTTVIVTALTDARGALGGFGVKFETGAERSRLMNAEVLVDSVWHIWVAGRGGLMIEQSENRWPWLRDVVIPAFWDSADNWRGSWYGVMTAGPGALGTAYLHGGSGTLRGLDGEAVEAFRAGAYSSKRGPVDMHGSLTIALPATDAR